MYNEAQKEGVLCGRDAFAAWQTINGAELLVHFKVAPKREAYAIYSSDFYFHLRRLSMAINRSG